MSEVKLVIRGDSAQAVAAVGATDKALDTLGKTAASAGKKVVDGIAPLAPALAPVPPLIKPVGDGFEVAGKKVNQFGISVGQTSAAMRQLPAQFTDVVTQLQGGASPLTVLIQQGGQIKDSFGGVRPALAALAGYISPVAVGVGSVAAVLGTLAVAAYQGHVEQTELAKALLLTGDYAGISSSRFSTLASDISTSANVTVGASRELLLAATATGAFGSQSIGTVTTAMARLQSISGASTQDVVADFASMSRGVAAWAAEHNRQYAFLTKQTYDQIKALELQGKTEQAMALAAGKLDEALKDRQPQLGTLQRLWKGLAETASDAWGAMMGLGRQLTTREQLDVAMDRLSALGGNLQPKARAAAEQQVQFLKEALKLENQQATVRSANAAAERAAIAAKPPELTAWQKIKEKPYIPNDDSNYDQYDRLMAQLRQEKAASDDKGQFDAVLQKNEEGQAKQAAAAKNYLQDLRDLNTRAAASLLEDERARGEALIELDREIAKRRLDASGLKDGDRETALGLISDQALTARRNLESDLRGKAEAASNATGDALYTDVSNALGAALRDTKNPAKAFADALGNAVYTRLTASIADALATAAVGKDGKGGFLSSLVSAGLSFFGGGMTIDTGGYGITNGSTGGLVDNGLGGGRAGGGPVRAGTTYLVGERGPELLRMGTQGGSVIPNHALAGGGNAGGNVFVNVENNAGANVKTETEQRGSDRFVRLIIDQAADEVDRRIASGGSTDKVLRGVYGVGRGAGLARRG